MQNAFYFILKAILFFKMFKFFDSIFDQVGKRRDKKAKNNLTFYDVTDWTASNYSTSTAQYLKK